ncbi:MAG: hypothetical protein Q4D94_14450, partial [Bacillota bacterium]|nr:hypothetical protein [Bacillota bacterium]
DDFLKELEMKTGGTVEVDDITGELKLVNETGEGGTIVKGDAVPEVEPIPEVEQVLGGTGTSWADFMSLKDAETYNNWTDLREAGLDQAKINDIILTNKGYRPDPATYLSQEYIDVHLAQFDDGVSVIQTEWAYSRYSETNGFVGVPDDNSLFVMPKEYCDDVISRANGNISIIEKELGFPEGYFSDGGGLVRIDTLNTSELNIRMPSGNETGANKLWIPGGKTVGGVPEAITNTIPLKDTTVTRIDVD